MKALIMFCVILLMLCVLPTQSIGNQGVVEINPPRLIPDIHQRQVHSGDTFELVCESDQPIHWSYPKLHNEVGDEHISLVSITNSVTNDNKYHSVLKMTNAYFLDTGFYYCIVNGTTNLEEALENVTQIYIFVKDEENLFVIDEMFPVREANQYDTAIIPCRPTSLDVSVTLIKDSEVIPLGAWKEGAVNVTFDPTAGFYLNPINTVDSGIYECIATMGAESSNMYCQINVLKKSYTIPKPSINESRIHAVVVGDTLYLECLARASKGIKFSVNWFTPNKVTIKSGRAVIQEPKVFKDKTHNTYETAKSSLKIENVTLEDAGNYTCEVVDHNLISNSDIKQIKVLESGQHYINLTVDILNLTVRAGQDQVKWVIDVDSSIEPKFKWFDPSGSPVDVEGSPHKYKMEKQSGHIILIINKIKISDAGTYELHAYYSDTVEQQLNLTLIVTDKPAVTISNSITYYELHKSYRLECTVVGYPKPDVEWYFKECEFQEMDDCEDITFRKIEGSSEPALVNNAYIYTLVWMVETPGILKCSAVNSEGSGDESTSLLVTDIPMSEGNSGLVLWGKPNKIVEGDNITLHCGATKYNYSEEISWFDERNGYTGKLPVSNKSGLFITRNDTKYSYRSSLTLLELPMKSDATYICNANRKEDGIKDERTIIVEVLNPMKAAIKSSNMNNSVWVINSGNKLFLQCLKDGLPTPDIKWFKDGHDIGKSNNTRIIFENGNQNLIIPFIKEEDEGNYECVVRNRLGSSKKGMDLKLKDKPGLNTGLVAGIIVCSIILVFLIIVLGVRIQKEKKLRMELEVAGLANFEKGAMENINPELPVDDQAELLPYDKKWEFPRDKLKLGKQLGAGAFGVVLKGEAWGIKEGELKSTVAVKMVKRNADRTYIKALASELKIMIHLGKNLNVVNLLGACTKNLAKMELLVIVEYCRFGNLHKYLLCHREDFVDQVDPRTGEIDPAIGIDLLTRNESMKSKSKVKYAALSFSSSSGGSHSDDMAVDYRAACARRPGDQSPDPTTADTEMNLISMTPTGEHDEFMLSNNSIQPEWRSNYRADYKGSTCPVCTRDLLCWAFQVARGMDYLSSRKVMHGDLAARNILLADGNVVKICDFGLAKSMYKSDNYRKKGDGPLPVKWMAIESIRDRVFSTQSDVWSFGIVLWEFFSLARTPYPGMEADEKLYNKLVDGYRMEQPQYATREIYNTMMKCWQSRPIQRPSFSELSEKLGNMLEESVKRHYIDLNDPYMDMNAQWMEGLQNDYLGMMNAPTYGNMVSPTVDDDGHVYVNSPHRTETASPDGGEPSGYLFMKSPTAEVIFSPRHREGNVFRFSPHLQNQRRLRNSETEGAQKMEQKPMLSTSRNSSESDTDMDQQSDLNKGSESSRREQEDLNDTKQKDSDINEKTSFSNPSYQSVMPITPSADNYVNMPQQKKSKNDNKIIPTSEYCNEKVSSPESYKNSDNSSQQLQTSPTLMKKSGNALNQNSQTQETTLKNAFSNPNYQSQIKTNDTYVNIPSHNRKTSDASSGIQSDVGDNLHVVIM